MEFWVTIVGLLRRKRVIIPALVVALTLGAVAFYGTPNTYESHTTMVLTTTPYGGTESQDPTKPGELTNPMLNFNDSLKTTSAILIEAMNTKGVAEQLGATGATTLIINDGRTNPDLIGLNGPFLYVVGQSTSAAEAKNVVVQAQKLMTTKLREWQADLNAPQKTYLSLVDVVPPTTPQVQHSMKLGILAFLFGLMVSLGIAYFGHQFRARRRVRRAARAARAPAAPGTPLGVVPAPVEGSRPGGPVVPVPQGDEERTERPVVAPLPFTKPEPAVDPKPVAAPTPVVAPTPLSRPQPAVVPTPLKKTGPALVHAPVKLRIRSRNR